MQTKEPQIVTFPACSDISTNKGDLESDVSSLQAQRNADEATTDSDVSSLAGDISTNKGDLESDVSSLQAQRNADEATTDSDVSSLAGDISTNKGDLESDVSSLAALNSAGTGDLESDISSLQAQRDADEGTTDSDVSSLAGDISTNKGDLESDVSSLAASISLNDVVAVSEAVNGSEGAPVSQVTVSFGRTFASAPKVVGIMKAGSSSPIIACQLSSVTTTQAVFQLSDDIVTSSDYTLEVLASV